MRGILGAAIVGGAVPAGLVLLLDGGLPFALLIAPFTASAAALLTAARLSTRSRA
ncbi:hypothetical protein [Methylobacterium oryzihabitans]|uniref:hypothetical protein n=1 Tax=Methylobacterium oryzihabitans TaxID=2499852 RepID=UPI0016525ABD|nr:hypothetical protein [Methylobacterium oryzihabitans]